MVRMLLALHVLFGSVWLVTDLRQGVARYRFWAGVGGTGLLCCFVLFRRRFVVVGCVVDGSSCG